MSEEKHECKFEVFLKTIETTIREQSSTIQELLKQMEAMNHEVEKMHNDIHLLELENNKEDWRYD